MACLPWNFKASHGFKALTTTECVTAAVTALLLRCRLRTEPVSLGTWVQTKSEAPQFPPLPGVETGQPEKGSEMGDESKL